MTASEVREPLTADPRDARDRLLAALDGRLRAGCARELRDVTIEALADGATVSRATAYRYLGNKTRLRAHAAKLLVERYAPEAVRAASAPATASAKITAAMTFWSTRIGAVDLVRDALILSEGSPIHQQLRQAWAELYAPILDCGQADGQLRAELAAAEVLDWLIEQQLVLIRQGLTEHAAERWISRFVVPALRAQASDVASGGVVADCVATVQSELDSLMTLAARAQAMAADI